MKKLADLTAPVTPKRKLLEKDVQKQCVDWARARGYLTRKWSSTSQRSVPDYLMFGPLTKFWVEFKAPGKTSTAAQLDEQERLQEVGFDGFECDDFDQFRELVETLEEVTRRTYPR